MAADERREARPERPGTGFFGRLIGGEALAAREAATTQRLAATEALRRACEGEGGCDPTEPPSAP